MKNLRLKDENGFNVIKDLKIGNIGVKIIMISNHSKYQSLALHSHTYDYLDKPITYNDIKRTVYDLVSAEYSLQDSKTDFYFSNRNKMIRIKCDDIRYAKYSERRIILFTKTDFVEVHITMAEASKQLKMPQFCSPHKSFLVNFEYIKEIVKLEIHMYKGEIIPISQLRVQQITKGYAKYCATHVR